MPIEIRVAPHEVGIGVEQDSGNGMLSFIDKANGIAVSVLLTPEAWRGLIANMPRVSGIGIPIVGRAGVVIPEGVLHDVSAKPNGDG